MFTKKITESDAFLDMPLSTQCLYFHLNMHADDDGFVNSPRRIMRTIGASEDDLKILIAKAFVLTFESGVIVIKHWRLHNTLQNDRYHPTDYVEERALLDVKDNKSYTWKQNGNILGTELNSTQLNVTKRSDEDIQKEASRLREAFGDEIVNECEHALSHYIYTAKELNTLVYKMADGKIANLDAYVYTMMKGKHETENFQ